MTRVPEKNRTPKRRSEMDKNNSKTWTEEEVRMIIREEAYQIVNQRRNEILQDVGAFTLEGRVAYISRDGMIAASVDSHDIGSILRLHFPQGKKVKLLIVPDDLPPPGLPTERGTGSGGT